MGHKNSPEREDPVLEFMVQNFFRETAENNTLSAEHLCLRVISVPPNTTDTAKEYAKKDQNLLLGLRLLARVVYSKERFLAALVHHIFERIPFYYVSDADCCLAYPESKKYVIVAVASTWVTLCVSAGGDYLWSRDLEFLSKVFRTGGDFSRKDGCDMTNTSCSYLYKKIQALVCDGLAESLESMLTKDGNLEPLRRVLGKSLLDTNIPEPMRLVLKRYFDRLTPLNETMRLIKLASGGPSQS